jgi:hypothetical protein
VLPHQGAQTKIDVALMRFGSARNSRRWDAQIRFLAIESNVQRRVDPAINALQTCYSATTFAVQRNTGPVQAANQRREPCCRDIAPQQQPEIRELSHIGDHATAGLDRIGCVARSFQARAPCCSRQLDPIHGAPGRVARQIAPTGTQPLIVSREPAIQPAGSAEAGARAAGSTHAMAAGGAVIPGLEGSRTTLRSVEAGECQTCDQSAPHPGDARNL